MNTGWVGGGVGVGNRMSIKHTRACITSILNHSIEKAEFRNDPVFQFEVPVALEGVPSELCNPREAWR